MGFRNPITSLSASQITPGTLKGSILSPSDGIGARFDYTGVHVSDGTVDDASLTSSGIGGLNPAVSLAATGANSASGGTAATLTLTGAVALAGAGPALAELTADQVTINGQVNVPGTLTNPGLLAVSMLPGTVITKPRVVISYGSVTTDASGNVTFDVSNRISVVEGVFVSGLAGSDVRGSLVNGAPNSLAVQLFKASGATWASTTVQCIVLIIGNGV